MPAFFNADTCSLRNQSLENTLLMKINIKKPKYCQEAKTCEASFSPTLASCEAIFDNEAEVYFKLLATILSNGVQITQKFLCYIQAIMQICVIR